MKRILCTIFSLAALSPAVPGSAQLPQASAVALGMGGNMTAGAPGFAAVANNPAGLAVPGGPGFSLAIPSIAVESGLGPVSLSDLVHWDGQVVPNAVKERWLGSVLAAGGQSGVVDAGVSGFALSIGAFGLQVANRTASEVSLDPDAVELLLYGNAGRTGAPEDFELDGSSLDGFMLSTVALSWGMRATERLFVGVTGSYMAGNGLIVGRDMGTRLTSAPLSAELSFPILYPSTQEFGFDHGSGVGFDVGALWTQGSVTIGATVQNVVNTFEWKLDGMSYVPGQALFDGGSGASDFEEQPATSAPTDLIEAVAALTPRPVYAVGIAVTPSPILHLQADLKRRTPGGLALGPELHAGVGAELRAISFLPLRGHFAVVSGGIQAGGGATLAFGPVNLSGAIALRTRDVANATMGMLTLSFGGR